MILTKITLKADAPQGSWPLTIPGISALRRRGLTFTSPITIVAGENGSGKSTLVEGIAQAYGLDVRGGHGGRKYNNAPPVTGLADHLRLGLSSSSPAAKKRHSGFFLRAETSMAVFEYMSHHGVAGYGRDTPLSELSHGEGLREVFAGRFQKPDLYILDEPESGLSFEAQIAFCHVLQDLAATGSQIICATHSPVLSAVAGAQIIVFDSDGFADVTWKDLKTVQLWKRFMADPDYFLRSCKKEFD